jgi:hypothetical protein
VEAKRLEKLPEEDKTTCMSYNLLPTKGPSLQKDTHKILSCLGTIISHSSYKSTSNVENLEELSQALNKLEEESNWNKKLSKFGDHPFKFPPHHGLLPSK